MTKATVMEPTERIYEEIITRKLSQKKKPQLDRSLSCPGSRKHSREMGKHASMSKLPNMDDSGENIYAVVNGEDVEFRKFKDLIADDASNLNVYQSDKQIVGANGITQKSEAEIVANVKEPESDCDCSTTVKDAKKTSHIVRPTTLPIKDNETVYSEILHQTPGPQIDVVPGRLTRESDNPLLRQEFLPSNTPSPSTPVAHSRNSSLRRKGESIRSTSGDSGIQEDMQALLLYENFARRERKLQRSQSSPQFYANVASLKNATDTVYANMECNNAKMDAPVSNSSVYANTDNGDVENRPRASSRPIAIQSNQRQFQDELIYSDLDFEEEPAPEYFSGSTGDASSTSSGLSSFAGHLTNSFSPPPLPTRPPSVGARRRQTSFSSVSMVSSVSMNTLRANFIGTHSVHRANRESINCSVKDTVHKTNMLNVKSVFVDISKSHVKFCSLSSPYHCVLQLSVDEIHLLDTFSKDDRFMGFIVSQPEKEAVCHVLQSDQTAEILEAVKEVLKDTSTRQRYSSADRPRSYYGQAHPKSHGQFCYPGIVKIGSVKVKSSLLVINDSIHALLEKVNPKEYYRVDLEIKDSSTLLVTAQSRLKTEEHSVAWILSLGLYNNDGRYFGYIISKTKGGKTRMFCHVYKCSTVLMSATILEAIRSACQNSLTPGRAQAPRCSSSMPRSGFRSRLMTSPDAVSRSSASSDETVRDGSSPKLSRSYDFNHVSSKCIRELSYENEGSAQTIIGQTNDYAKGEDGSEYGMSSGVMNSLEQLDITSNEEESAASNVTDFVGNEAEISEKSDVVDGLPESDVASVLNEVHDFIPATVEEENPVSAAIVDNVDLSPNVHDGDLTTQGTDEVKKPEHLNEAKENHKDKHLPFSKKKSKIFRGTLMRKKKDSASKLSASMQSLDSVPKEEEEPAHAPIRKEHNFVVSYLCSAVVKPPFKSKHVEKCFKQYQKEVGKKQKVGDICSLGNKLTLQVITDEGVTMLDIRNPNSFRRHFPLSTIDSFIVHPENPDCFAFSTTVPGDEQHKYHLFYKSRDSITSVKEAFEQLKQFQRVL